MRAKLKTAHEKCGSRLGPTTLRESTSARSLLRCKLSSQMPNDMTPDLKRMQHHTFTVKLAHGHAAIDVVYYSPERNFSIWLLSNRRGRPQSGPHEQHIRVGRSNALTGNIPAYASCSACQYVTCGISNQLEFTHFLSVNSNLHSAQNLGS